MTYRVIVPLCGWRTYYVDADSRCDAISRVVDGEGECETADDIIHEEVSTHDWAADAWDPE